MNSGLPNRRSDFELLKSPVSEADGPPVPLNPTLEIIDTPTLAARLSVPASWIASHTRARATDVIPHLRLGKYCRFRWGSEELTQWLQDHMEGV